MASIEGHVPDRRGIGLGHRDVGILAEAVEAVRRHVDGEIDLARLDGGEPRLGLDDGHVDGLAQLRRTAPVLVIAREDHLHAGLPRLELEGPGAHGILHDVLAVLLERVGAVDEERLMREVLEKRREGRLELDLHGERVDHLDALHVAEEALDVGIGARLVVRPLLVQLPLVAELDRLGIEGRAVVKGHVGAQVEGIDEAVLGDVPAARETGNELVGAELLRHQPFEDALGHPRRIEIRDLRRIHGDGLGEETDDDGILGRRGIRARGQCHGQDHEGNHPGSTSRHGLLLWAVILPQPACPRNKSPRPRRGRGPG